MLRVVLCLLVVFLVPPPAAPAAATGPTFRGDAQAVAEFQAAFEKFASARSWRAKMTLPGGAGTQNVEFVAPDRFRMIMTQGGTTSEMFMIGREFWLRAGNTCQKVPAAMQVANPREWVQSGPQATMTVSKGGPETVEGTPTQTYTVIVDSQGTQTRQKLYVALSTGLPRRIEVQSDRGPVVIDYSDYGAQIAINNPPC